MRVSIFAGVVLATLALAAPAGAALSWGSRGMEEALDKRLATELRLEYASQLEDSEYECERVSSRWYECDVMFRATALEEYYIDDWYGDETLVEEGEMIECETYAEVRRRGWSSRKGTFRIGFEEPICELVTDESA